MVNQFKIIHKESEDGRILFIPQGIDTLTRNASLVPDFIKKDLKADEIDYIIDFFDTYEKGYFIKNNIKVEIEWSIYFDYFFFINGNSKEDEILKVQDWVVSIYNAIVKDERTETKF
ncbi:hypothetical protein [Flavobacterium terrisoli]|uniref:hypothetical protein n=1 Tax=Flavobacterium terrisoli TaxID=3242195 RepID=UPI002542C500|nr:hypothetical protein [Flavobacterium buctense]